MSLRTRLGTLILAVTLIGIGSWWVSRLAVAAQASPVQPAAEHNFRITAKRYSFTPNRIEVTEGDLIRVELRADDIAHSLTIDDYRISKRVEAGQPVVLEFRAERAGTFPFYCNLQIDEGCRSMRGELIVRARLR